MIDTVFVRGDFHSIVVRLLARTREPFVRIVNGEHDSKAPYPYILTQGGIVFGLPALVDFLLTRVTEPSLLYPDVRRRALQMTVFWALVDREFGNLIEASDAETGQWLANVTDQLRCNKFYTGDEFSLCDIGMLAILEFIHNVEGSLPPTHVAYRNRCYAAIAKIEQRNNEVLNDVDA